MLLFGPTQGPERFSPFFQYKHWNILNGILEFIQNYGKCDNIQNDKNGAEVEITKEMYDKVYF